MLGSGIATPSNERPAHALILTAYAVIVGIGVAVHEPWWDEAQAWLLARDASLHDLLTTWLAYEGHPPLWYLILMIPAKLGLPYKSINIASALIGIAGVVILLGLRDAPLLLRASVPFTFYSAYQYTVVSRSYVLMPPLLFWIAALYSRRDERIVQFAVLLSLLSLMSVHGACLAVGFVLLLMVDLWRGRLSASKISFPALAIAASILALTGILLIVILWPRTDLVTGSLIDLSFRPSKMAAISMSVLTETYLGSSAAVTLAVSMVLSAVLLFWLYQRGRLLEFVVLFVTLLPVSSMYFARWHEGVFFWVIVFALLLPPAKEQRSAAVAAAGWAVIAVMLLLQTVWTARSLVYDVRSNFTGSRDAAMDIRKHRIERARLFGAGVRCLELQPYFRTNIFANYAAPGGAAFWDWSRNNRWPYPAPAPDLRLMAQWLSVQLAGRPDYFLTASGFRADGLYAALLRRRPEYREIARFRGGLFWKDRVIERIDFALFERR